MMNKYKDKRESIENNKEENEWKRTIKKII